LGKLFKEYKCAMRRDLDWREKYKGVVMTKDDMGKRCDILYDIYTKKERYVKMYHGKMYEELSGKYKKALREYSLLREGMELVYIEEVIKTEDDRKRDLYRCVVVK